jgi:two-component system response regulator TctD
MHILLIEDDGTIARELEWRWRGKGWGVAACATLGAADRPAEHLRPDVIVLDLNLPDGDGLAWLERFRSHDRHTPVIALTARDRVTDRVEGLRRGADDYLVKPFSADELDARIEALQRRSGSTGGDRVEFGRLVLLRDERQAFVDTEPLELHPREFEVLGLLMRRAPRLVARRFIVEVLAERNVELGDSAVDVYISRLRRKLAGSGVAIVTVRGFGYRLEPENGAGAAGDTE